MEKNISFFVKIEKLKKARKREKASEKEIFEILKDAYNKKIVFKSQDKLIKYLKEKVGNKNLPSKEKIRKIIIKVGYKIKYSTKKVDKELNKCPICFSPLFEKYSINLRNEKIIEYYYCKFCNFKTKDKRDLPIKLKFIL
ncbi:MAG: hypothetical protein QXW35_00985 [Candidatus Aenigmatarchaeota archaeon]